MTDHKLIPLTAHLRNVADSVAAWFKESQALHPVRTIDEARAGLDTDGEESA